MPKRLPNPPAERNKGLPSEMAAPLASVASAAKRARTVAVSANPMVPAPLHRSSQPAQGPKDLQGIFGESLKSARLEHGFKQSDIAARTGLTQQYLSRIEAGQRNVTLKTMFVLAEIVGKNVADMLRHDSEVSKKRPSGDNPQ